MPSVVDHDLRSAFEKGLAGDAAHRFFGGPRVFRRAGSLFHDHLLGEGTPETESCLQLILIINIRVRDPCQPPLSFFFPRKRG